MIVNQPEELYGQWVEAFNSGNREAFLSLYEAEATMIVQPGVIVKGKEAIGQALEAFLALKGKIELTPKLVVTNSDVALMMSEWSLQGTDAEGNSVTLGGQTADVARRQSDGRWLLVIDNPYGIQAAL